MESRAFYTVAALLILSSVPATSAEMCASYKPMTATELNRRSLVKGTEKGEYETTVEWKKRLENIFPSNKPIVAAVKVSNYDEKYDADRRDLNISTTGLTSRSMTVSADFDTLILGTRSWSEPGYVGQNAMGVSREISVDHYDSFVLYWPHKDRNLFDYANSISLPSSIDLPIDAASAKDLRGHLSFVMVGVPAPPYIYSDYHRSVPTISEPQEGHYYERGLVITPRCAALVDDRTWKPVLLLDPTDLSRHAK